jgi:hypothetical protein
MATGPSILDVLEDPALLGKWFAGASWAAWRSFLAAVFALPMSEDQLEVYRGATGRQRRPEAPAREAWVVVGRRGGKSRIAAAIAVYLAAFRSYQEVLAPGEVGTVMIIAADRKQARTVLRYIRALLGATPLLAQLVERQTRESIHLTNRVVIEVHTCSYKTTRGYSLIAVLAEEIAFWRTHEESESPDREIIHGIRPGLATIPGSLLIALSSPYARKGMLYETYARHYGREDDGVLVWKAPSRVQNPLLEERVVQEALEEDEGAARAEWLAEFRTDVESYVSREAVAAVVVQGRRELPPLWSRRYVGFCDPAGGSGGDSMTLAIAHMERDRAVVDALLEAKPPFSPEEITAEFCAALKGYNVRKVVGDRYAGEWPRESFRKNGVSYEVAEQTKSEIYRELLPLLNSKRIELLDERRLLGQLLALEKRTGWAGKDLIGHPPGGRDDCINAAAGAVLLAWGGRRRGRWPVKLLSRPTVELIPPHPAAPGRGF